MTSEQLELWLCGRDQGLPTAREIAGALGLRLEAVEDTTLLRVSERRRTVRFLLAVLRDLFSADRDVRAWLRAPRAELAGRPPLDALLGGRLAEVEALAVADWHRPQPVPRADPVARQAGAATARRDATACGAC